MKVLQVNSVYKNGSTGKIIDDNHRELQQQGVESIICYGRGVNVSEKNVYKTCGEFYSKLNNLRSRFTGLMYGGCFFSTCKLISIIKKEKPDIVHLHCINGYFVNIYQLTKFLKKSKIKTVLTLHAEFIYTGNCGIAFDCEKWKTGCGNCPRYKKETKSLFFDRTRTSWQKMKNAFDGFDENLIVASVSPWLMERAMRSPILANKKHCVIQNGVDTSIFHPYDTTDIREKYGLSNEKVIFHATAGFKDDPQHIKGGYYVLQLAERLKNENVKIFVAGKYDSSIIPPSNVVFLGRILDQTLLAQHYSMADVTLLTSKKETFSMICAESLCCGTPVVGFKAGGPESISLPEYSEFIGYGDLNKIEFILQNKFTDKKAVIPKKAFEQYNKKAMTSSYLQIYNQLTRME